MHRDGVQHDLQRPLAAHLARGRPRFSHPVEHLEQMPVGTLVFVNRHRTGRLPGPFRVPSRRVKRAAALFALLALAAPSAAAAHATLVRTSPANGAVLTHAPRSVRVFFDDTVRAGKHNAAVANRTGASVLAGKPRAAGRVLTIPLRRGLAQADYSVRWSIVSDDGHPEEGVLAFAVGAGSAAPQSILDAAAPLGWFDVVLRTLYYAGVLAGGGAVAFALLAWPILGERLRRPLAHLFFLALLSLFLGASGIVHGAISGTRYDLVLKVALVVSVLGAAAAALAPLYRRLLPVCGACSVGLVAAPTLAGHALDANQPRWLSVPVDLNFFTDRERKGALVFSPTEGDVILGLTSTWDVWPGALEVGARFEHDRPIDRAGFSQTYGDFRMRYLYSASVLFPGLKSALRDGDVSGWVTAGAFALNPTYAARPDNSGLALFRYGWHGEVSVWGDAISVGLDATMFSDRQNRNALNPTELDITPEIVGRLPPFNLHVAYERDLPLDRGGLTQEFVYVLLGYEFDLKGAKGPAKGMVPSP